MRRSVGRRRVDSAAGPGDEAAQLTLRRSGREGERPDE